MDTATPMDLSRAFNIFSHWANETVTSSYPTSTLRTGQSPASAPSNTTSNITLTTLTSLTRAQNSFTTPEPPPRGLAFTTSLSLMLLSTLTTASAASLSSTSPSKKSASTNTSLLASTNGDSGNILSTRAKAGTGVGASIGITAILLGILLFILHHRKNRRPSTQSYPSLASRGTSRLGGRECVSRADLDSYGMRIITPPNKDELGGQLQSPGRLYLMPDGRHGINEPGNARMVEQKSFSRLLELPSDSTLGGDSSDDRQYSELSTSYSGISLVDTRSLGHGSEHALSVEYSDIELGEASVVRTQQARVVDDKIPGQEFRKESTTLPGDAALIRTQ